MKPPIEVTHRLRSYISKPWGSEMGFEIDFLCVGEGSGDAICIRHGDASSGYWVEAVDGGHTSTAETIIAHIEKYYHGPETIIANVILSHADDDHARGLLEVLRHFKVQHLWMNRPWLYAAETLASFHGNYTLAGLVTYMRDKHPYLVEMEEIAAEKGILIHEVFQGDIVGPFRILAPSRERYIRLIPDLEKTPPSYAEKRALGGIFDAIASSIGKKAEEWGFETLSDSPPATSASNETSLVQLGIFGDHTILLTGDVGPEGLTEAADYAESLGLLAPPSLVQVPHHGSRRNVTPTVLDRWLGKRLPEGASKRGDAVCSVGSNAEGYPRAVVSNAFLRRGYEIASTKDHNVLTLEVVMNSRNWPRASTIPFAPEVEDYA